MASSINLNILYLLEKRRYNLKQPNFLQMKTIIAFFYFSLLCLTSIGQVVTSPIPEEFAKTDLQRMNLYGKAKSVRQTSFAAIKKSGVIQKGKRKIEEPNWAKDFYIVFNSTGNKTELCTINSNGSVDNEISWQYDDSGNMVEDHRGNSDKVDTTKENKFTYKFDDKGNIIERDRFNAKGIQDVTEIYKYDERGNVIVKSWVIGNTPCKDSLVYDEKNNMIEQYATNVVIPGKWKFTYRYDEKGNCMEENWFTDGVKFYIKYTFKYDDKGNRSEVVWTNAKGKSCKWTFQYEFDSNGNWIKSTQFLNGKPNYILEREITYF